MGFESVVVVTVPVGVAGLWGALYMLGAPFSLGIRRLVVGQFGSVPYHFLPVLVVVFYLILSINLWGLVPIGLAVSALGCVTLSLGVSFWLANYLYCLRARFVGNVSHFLPVGTPVALMIMLVWIEVVSWLARPLALGVRLMANITAGHLLLHLLAGGVFYLVAGGWILGGALVVAVSVVVVSLMVVLELAVAVIQAYVFSLLVFLYVDEGLDLG